ncbi:hypothetical protein [Acidomonas methanolica]|nr:hypothetical protein [Acidomonas methanolica]
MFAKESLFNGGLAAELFRAAEAEKHVPLRRLRAGEGARRLRA